MPASDKQHKATPHKLRKARERGELPYSRDFSSALGFTAALATLLATWHGMLERLHRVLLRAFDPKAYDDPTAVTQMVSDAVWALLPVLAAAVIGSVLGGLIQTKGNFSAHPLVPKFEKLNPASGLKNMFEARRLFDLAKVVLKLVLVGWIAWYVLRGSIGTFVSTNLPAHSTLGAAEALALRTVFTYAAAALLLLALVDLAHQMFEFAKQQRMDKDELKREQKDLEGDPKYRAARKAAYRELMAMPVQLNVRNASVVVTNPTHFAVALCYRPPEVAVPLVVAKGSDDEAQGLRSRAFELGIPVLSRPPLARQLFADLRPGQYIQDEHLEAVAEVIRWVQSMQTSRRA